MKSKVLALGLLASLSIGAQAGDTENVLGGVILGAVIAHQFSDHDRPVVSLPVPRYAYPPQVIYAPPVMYYPPQVVYAEPQVIYAPQPDYSYRRQFRDHHDHDWHHRYERSRW